MIRVVVTGGEGQLGRALAREAPEGWDLRVLPRSRLDVTDPEEVRAVLGSLRPQWVVNAAAYTRVDQAEAEPERAAAVNRDGARHVAEACAAVGARMVQVSTDYVFDGTKGSPYRPDDPPNPVNTYGRTKLEGERAVLDVLGDRACVLRTAWVYSVEGPSFLTTMLRLLPERDELRVVEDQIGTPTSAVSLARAVVRIVERGVAGVHHWTDAGVASWYDFAVAIAEELHARGRLPRMPRIAPIPTSAYPTPARRPPYSVLDKTTTREALGLEPAHWRTMLRETLDGLGARKP